MAVNVIPIEHEYGNGAGDVARKLGTCPGWEVRDERLTAEIARLMECDCRTVEMLERRHDALYYWMLKAFFRGSAEGVTSVPHLTMVDVDCIRQVVEQLSERSVGPPR
jgi:hypothetical protein